MKIKLVATDLDGTFLNDNKEITGFTENTVRRLGDMGVYFVPATGRAFDAVPKEVLELPDIEYVITSNGAAVYSISQEKRIYQCPLNPASVDRVLEMEIPETMGVEAFVEGTPYSEERYIAHPEDYGATEYGAVYVKNTRRPVKNIFRFIREHRENLDSLSFVCADAGMRSAFCSLLKEKVPDIYVTSSVSHMLEIGHINAGKGKTLRYLLSTLGISPDEAMAFGDADNDIDMLLEVKYGIAMANASESCRKAAFAVTDSNNEDGFAKGILRFCRE